MQNVADVAAESTVSAPSSQSSSLVPSDKDAGHAVPVVAVLVVEIGGPAGPEPTRYGDWERKGRCIDF